MPEVLDLFAGPGGWDEGMMALGLTDVLGLDLDLMACTTAEAAGHKRERVDVRHVRPDRFALIVGLVGSPPCTTFSLAGHGGGRRVSAAIHGLIDDLGADRDARRARRRQAVRELRGWALHGYPKATRRWRSAWAGAQADGALLVAEPLRFALALRPEWVTLEQVPAVLPIWRHIAHVLRGHGYHAWTGILNAADFGVPQTRRRAVLIASRVHPVGPPEATHAREPGPPALFGETPEPWVSMAEALGWLDGPAVRTSYGVPIEHPRNGAHVFDSGVRPAHTVTGKGRSWEIEVSNRSEVGGTHVPYRRDVDEPSPTLVANVDRWRLHAGKQGNATTRSLDEPAPTVAFGKDMASWRLRNNTQGNACERGLDEPAGTLFFGARQNDVSLTDGQTSRRLTIAEAAVLQSFRPDYPWQGSRTQQFQQIGNAIPPVLATAIARAATGRSDHE